MSVTVIEGQGITTTNSSSAVIKIRKDEGDLMVHKINTRRSRDLLLLMNTRVRSGIPPRLKQGTVIFTADIKSPQFEGRALVFETLKDGESPENWRNPVDGKIIPKGLVALKSCERTTGCSCPYNMLRRHFSRQYMHSLGWSPLKNRNGRVRALVVIDQNQN